MPHASASAGSRIPAAVALAAASLTVLAGASFARRRLIRRRNDDGDADGRPTSKSDATSQGGYESLIGNTPLLYLPNLSSLLPNDVKVYVKMESMNPGGTGKDRAARSMIVNAEGRGDLPPPVRRGSGGGESNTTRCENSVGVEVGDDGGHSESSVIDNESTIRTEQLDGANGHRTPASTPPSHIPPDIHEAIGTALRNTQTHGIIVEGTSGSTGISLASISCSRGHAVIVVLPDDQSTQKADFLRRLGCGVVVVQNCSISNPGHYVNVARRVWEWLEVERRYDGYYWEEVARRTDGGAGNGVTNGRHAPKLIRAAFMNQFENLANVQSHYRTTGPEIYSQLDGKVDAFVMSAGTGGTLVGVGGYLKERWWRNQRATIPERHSSPPKIVLVDPPGSSLYNKIKHGVAYARQQSEQKLRRHRYDTLAEGIGLDRITANFGLGCEGIGWEQHGDTAFRDQIRMQSNSGDPTEPSNRQPIAPSGYQSKIIDDAIAVTDQQAVYMAHFLLRHEGLFVGSSTAMNLVGAMTVAPSMPRGSNVVTVVCDGGQRHTSRFWNRDFIEEWGLVWPGDAIEGAASGEKNCILSLLGIASGKK